MPICGVWGDKAQTEASQLRVLFQDPSVTVKRWGSAREEALALRAVWVAGLMSSWMWVFYRERGEGGFQIFSQDDGGE